MTAPQIRFSSTQLAQIVAAAEAAYPDECCGLIAGYGEDVVIVSAIVAAANVADEPWHRFLIDPQAHFDLLRRLRGGDTRIIGHYHSHPNGGPALSRHDLAMADDPNAVWVVVPVEAPGQARAPQAFRCPSPAGTEAVEIGIQ